MKTNGVPAMVMLLAGFVDCLIAIRTHMTLGSFTRQLFLVLLICENCGRRTARRKRANR